jgi:hypothetical protein
LLFALLVELLLVLLLELVVLLVLVLSMLLGAVLVELVPVLCRWSLGCVLVGALAGPPAAPPVPCA